MQGQRSNIAASPTPFTASEVGTELLETLTRIFNHLSRLVLEHPNCQDSDTREVDGIRLYEKEPRMAACETTLQKAVVTLDAITELLKLLVEQSDPTSNFADEFTRIEQSRTGALFNAHNVVCELRESCYSNLRLWDMLVERTVHESTPNSLSSITRNRRSRR